MAEFALRHVAPRREALARPGRFPQELWTALGEAGLLGIAAPERFGGLGGGYRDLVLAGAALVRVGGNLGFASSWLGHCLTGRFFLQRFASPPQQARWLPLVARGEATLAVAISEPGAGAHPKHLKSSARRDGGVWRLAGEKAYVTNGPIAAAFIVLAVSAVEAGRKRFSAFLVPRDTPGLALVPGPVVDFLRPAPHCGLRLEDCAVPEDALIGAEGRAFETMSIPFRAVEDAVAAGKLSGALQHLLDRAAALAPSGEAREAAAAELGALAGLAAALETLALGLAEALDDAAEDAPAQTARLVGSRVLTQLLLERLHALAARLGLAWSAAEAALLRDLDKSLDIAKVARLATQTRLGLSVLEHATS
ncbi:MAG: acyl-CoA dehydrogenase family protein [Stellaceae bacterium]